MSEFLNERKNAVSFLLLLLFLLLALFYVYLINPAIKQKDAVQSDLNLVELENESLQKKLGTVSSENGQNAVGMQKKLPFSPGINWILLDLQQIETAATSQIRSISFTEGTATANLDEIMDGENQELGEVTPSDQEPTAEHGINNVNPITIHLDAVSPDFARFLQFLQGVETMERITNIESLSFTPAAGTGTEISFSFDADVFYYDDGGQGAES